MEDKREDETTAGVPMEEFIKQQIEARFQILRIELNAELKKIYDGVDSQMAGIRAKAEKADRLTELRHEVWLAEQPRVEEHRKIIEQYLLTLNRLVEIIANPLRTFPPLGPVVTYGTDGTEKLK